MVFWALSSCSFRSQIATKAVIDLCQVLEQIRPAAAGADDAELNGVRGGLGSGISRAASRSGHTARPRFDCQSFFRRVDRPS